MLGRMLNARFVAGKVLGWWKGSMDWAKLYTMVLREWKRCVG